ncbi:MAG: TSUP family transporter [Sarcina sp.]
MIFELDYILVGLMQVIGFFIQGAAGFGCTVIAAPVTNGILGTAVGVPYGTLICIPFMYYLGIKAIKDVSWKDLIKILALCAPGLLVGNYLFYQISESTAKICIGAMVTSIALMNIYKYILKPWMQKRKNGGVEVEKVEEVDTIGKKVYRYGCLLLGGIVHGAFTIGGPLITVYTLEAVKDKEKFRNTMMWVWALLNTVNGFNQYRNGAFTPEMWGAIAIGLPLAAIGFFFGIKFLKKINREQFLRFVYVVLLGVGGDMLIRNILAVM